MVGGSPAVGGPEPHVAPRTEGECEVVHTAVPEDVTWVDDAVNGRFGVGAHLARADMRYPVSRPAADSLQVYKLESRAITKGRGVKDGTYANERMGNG